jgi:hypothetical protein
MSIKRRIEKAFGCHEKEEVKVEKCKHDWVVAGPAQRLDGILEQIEGISVRENLVDAKSTSYGRLTISVDGRPVYRDYKQENYWEPLATWHNDHVQGSVCVLCSECVNAAKLCVDKWTKRRDEARERTSVSNARLELAEKIWGDSTCKEGK